MPSIRLLACYHFPLLALLAVATATAAGQELREVLPAIRGTAPEDSQFAYPPADDAVFGAGHLARKPLPPRDCWRCFGPAPCAPCDTNHGRFLYYGTYALDDDPKNSMHDCPSGNCGAFAAGITRAWIRLQESRPHWGSVKDCHK
ncbi:hypothetical protein [Lignipirellula cremea]|uniref:Uncharacterized protein n=1 Tax=Lignipirellula cremea TaxID=2528010 RepID=A0A518DM16_9BACT|nr:hypothetical protein [Lignipirellula cremea]QDU92863.1 hypothetical protein Pla8534_06360 [Lignipirellula cremea]